MNNRHFSLILQQLRKSRRLIIVWSSVWILLSLLFATVFKTFSASAVQSAKIYESLPPAVLKTVNIPTDYLTTPEKFLSGQFLTVFLLAGSILAVTLSVNAIGGRIQNRSIVSLLTKNLSRPFIYLALALTLAIVIITINIVVGASLYVMFTLFGGMSPSLSYIISFVVGATVTFTTFVALGQLLGTVLQKNHASSLGYAFAVVSFFANGLGSLSGVPSWIRKSSVYYYFDTLNLSRTNSLEIKLLILLLLTFLLLLIGVFAFRKKDIYV